MKSSFLQHLFDKVPSVAPLYSPADHDAVVTLHLPEWRLLRFAYHPHLNPLPSKEREFWLAMTSLWLTAVTGLLFTKDGFCIPRKEKEYE